MQFSLSNIEYSYPSSSEPALRKVTATFPQGWAGIVGDNGSGKTTLALVACNIIHPDAGILTPVLLARYCAQDATIPPEGLEDFALAYDETAVRLRRDLHIADDWAWRYDTLSSGQQKRLQIACSLWVQPDVLVVDEPTNHVDAATRRAIAKLLSRFEGIGLLISHDRELLDSLARSAYSSRRDLPSCVPAATCKDPTKPKLSVAVRYTLANWRAMRKPASNVRPGVGVRRRRGSHRAGAEGALQKTTATRVRNDGAISSPGKTGKLGCSRRGWRPGSLLRPMR